MIQSNCPTVAYVCQVNNSGLMGGREATWANSAVTRSSLLTIKQVRGTRRKRRDDPLPPLCHCSARGCVSPVNVATAAATSPIRARVYVPVTEEALCPANACATAKPA